MTRTIITIIGFLYCINTVNAQTIINSNLVLGNNSLIIQKPTGIYFEGSTFNSTDIYYLDVSENISLLLPGSSLQFEHNGLIFAFSQDGIFTFDNTNTISIFYEDQNVLLVSQRIVMLNNKFYFVGYSISTNSYELYELDSTGTFVNSYAFPAQLQNTIIIHEDAGVLYIFSNLLGPFHINNYFKFDPSNPQVVQINEMEYDGHPYPFINPIEELNINGEIFSININGQMTSNLSNGNLTCFDLVNEEALISPKLIGYINDKIYLSLNFNYGSPNGIYRYPEDVGNGLCNNCFHSDMEALLDLYEMTNGDFWTNTFSNDRIWFEDCDPCGVNDNTPWYGITCVNNRVTEIDLSSNNLTGMLPSNLDGLTFLEKLIINDNSIGGPLPPDYANLPNFIHFNAVENNLTGGIPPEYCAFIPQAYLAFANNNLSDCYDPVLSCLCGLSSPNPDVQISNGNNFPVPFSTFCATGDGDCSDNCMDFDGVDDYLQLSNYSLPLNAFTINFWVKAIDNNNTSETRLFSTAGNGSVLEIGIEKGGSSDGNLWIHDSRAVPSVFASNTFIEDGLWHHITLVRNGNSGLVYVDGMNIHSYTTSGFPVNGYGTSTRIGDYIGSGSFLTNLQGQMDDIAIWNFPLSQADILNLQTCELTGAELGLSAFWDFNLGISEANNNQPIVANIPDQTGNGNNLSILNFTLDGVSSNLVTSTTGVSNNCNICASPPTAICNSSLQYFLDQQNTQIIVDVTDVDNGSFSNCGPVSLSFDANSIQTQMIYNCIQDIGVHQLTLYVTENGKQSSCVSAVTISLQGQLKALHDFYESTHGDQWANTLAGNRPWFSNCKPCGDTSQGILPWFGIQCSANKEVRTIYLPNNKLTGVLPASLSGFPQLSWFDVTGSANDKLHGTLPDICGLPLLYFVVGNNQFTGGIPSCLA